MVTMNTTVEQVLEHHMVTSGGDHLLGYLLVRTPYGDAYKRGSLYHCANCHCVLRQTYNYDYTAMMAAHAPSCSNPVPPLAERPIAVGDYVRWEFPRFNKFADGEIVDMSNQDKHEVAILVDRCTNEWSMEDGPHPMPGAVHVFGIWGMGRHDDPVMRRIPRPFRVQEAQRQPFRNGALQDVGWTSESRRADALMYTMQAAPRIAVDQVRREFQIQPKPPGPTLYDGLTADECFVAFNRWQRVESPNGQKVLAIPTITQVNAARALWSAQLRAKVAAGDAARKAREPSVLVQLEDD